ncbi:MAG: single-stranded DNA-binding protein [Blastocatellia bacterium]|jgi:single-strand DNA-binding protein
MASFNKIIIVGHLGRDQETRYTPQGTAVSNFSLATSERRKDKSGEQQDITTWFRVSLWGKQAENIGQYLLKGRQVYVEGRLRTEEYTDRDGNKRMSLEVSATDVQLLGSKGEGPMGGAPTGGGGSAGGGTGYGSYNEPSTGGSYGKPGGSEDDIPF